MEHWVSAEIETQRHANRPEREREPLTWIRSTASKFQPSINYNRCIWVSILSCSHSHHLLNPNGGQKGGDERWHFIYHRVKCTARVEGISNSKVAGERRQRELSTSFNNKYIYSTTLVIFSIHTSKVAGGGGASISFGCANFGFQIVGETRAAKHPRTQSYPKVWRRCEYCSSTLNVTPPPSVVKANAALIASLRRRIICICHFTPPPPHLRAHGNYLYTLCNIKYIFSTFLN